MGSKEVKLLSSWPSPYVIRAKIALHAKGVEFESLDQDLFNKGELLLRSNPVHRKIPVLIHGDRNICESLIIIEYVDEVWDSGLRLLPRDPYDRAVQRFWAAYIDSTWFPNLRAIIMSLGDESVLKERSPQVHEGLKFLEDALIECSKGKQFFGGDEIGYLDIALGSLVGWIKAAELTAHIDLIDEERTPNLFKWAQNISDHDSVKNVLPRPERLAEYGKELALKLRA